MIVIKRALYEFSVIGAYWYRQLSNTLRSIGFKTRIFGRGVWIELAESGEHY